MRHHTLWVVANVTPCESKGTPPGDHQKVLPVTVTLERIAGRVHTKTVPLDEDLELGVRDVETEQCVVHAHFQLTDRIGQASIAKNSQEKGLEVALRRREIRIAIDK